MGDNKYVFSSWNPTIGQITADTTYTAQYTHSYVYANYTNLASALTAANNMMNSADYQAGKYTAASMATLVSATATGQTAYDANPHLYQSAQATVDNYTAAINNALNGLVARKYTVRFYNNGELVKTQTDVAWGDSATAPSITAIKPATGDYHYTLKTGSALWDRSFTNIKDSGPADMTIDVHAQYDNIPHTFVDTSIAATCAHGSQEHRECTVCGYSTTIDLGAEDPNNHEEQYLTYKFKNDSDKPTCTQDGTLSLWCTACENWINSDYSVGGNTYTATKTIAALGHDFLFSGDDYVAPTCTDEGSAKCSRCSETHTIAALGHSYNDGVVTEATCTQTGSVVYTCLRDGCGHTMTKTLAKKPHTFTKDGTHHAATCITPGYYEVICNVCNAAAGFNRYVTSEPALGHDFVPDTSKGANGVADGKLYLKCNRSGCTEAKEFPLPTDVDNASVSFTVVDATCAAAGSVTITYTVNGGAEQTKNYTIPINASAHTAIETRIKNAATCTDDGQAQAYCTGCNNWVGTAVTIPATGHSYDFNAPSSVVVGTCQTDASKTFTCTNGCGHSETVTTGKGPHNFVAGTLVPATCTTPAYTPYACNVQGCTEHYNSYDTLSDPVGHDWNTTGGTLVDNGTKVRITCNTCGDHMDVAIPTGADNVSIGSIVEATCSAKGSAVVSYTVNGVNKTASVELPIDPAHHTGLTTEITTAPTCTAGGKVTTYCTACGSTTDYISQIDIPAKGHAWRFPGSVTISANCKTHEVRTISCANCTETKSITSDTFGPHSYDNGTTHAATCLTPAYTTYTCQISGCGNSYNEYTGNALGHDFVADTGKGANGVADGKLYLKCNRSGCTETKEFPLPTDVDNASVTFEVTNATCSAEGNVKITYTVNGGATQTKNYTIPQNPSAHTTYKQTQTVDPTCTTTGTVEVRCEACNALIQTVTLPAIGHNFSAGRYTDVSSTCQTQGTRTYTCTRANCGATLADALPLAGHAYVAGTKVSATCTTPAYTPFHCSVDGCTAAYNSYDTSEPAIGHTYATKLEHGVATVYCTKCSWSQTVAVPESGHTFTAAVTTQPTCHTKGEITFTCTDAGCGQVFTAELDENPDAHDALTYSSTDATCTAQGTATLTCSSCGWSHTENTTPVVPHRYSREHVAVTTVATCHSEGVRTYTCDYCGGTVTEPIPMTQHNYVVDRHVDATCTTSGYDVMKCSADGCTATYNRYDPADSAGGHDYKFVSVSHGTVTVKCELCNDIKTYTLDSDTSGHVYDTYTVLTAPTCQAEGRAKISCSADNAEIEFDIPIDPNNHTNVQTHYTAATCQAPGSVETKCDACNVRIGTLVTIPQKEHVFDVTAGVITQDATCQRTGVMTFTCTTCPEGTEKATATQTIPVKNHNYVLNLSAHADATCTTPAYDVYVCDMCGASYNSYVAGSQPTGHTYTWRFDHGEAIGTCQNCGDGMPNHQITVAIPDGDGHNFEAEVTAYPTCNADGTIVFTCSDAECDKSYTVTLPKDVNSHGHQGYTVAKTDSTCQTPGSIVVTCVECGNVVKTEALSTVPHLYTKEDMSVKTPATCISEGKYEYICHYGCGTKVDGETIAMKQHSFSVTSTEPATCLTPAYDVYTCSQDGCTATYKVATAPALGHSYGTAVASHGQATLTCTREGCTATAAQHSITVPISDDVSGHIYTIVTDVVQPTCMKTGSAKLVCADGDGAFIDVVLPINPAAHNLTYSNNPATCTVAGSVTCTCTNKDDEDNACTAFNNYEVTVIPAKGHTYSQTAVRETPATCTEEGSRTYYCTVCDQRDADITNVLPKLQHVFHQVGDIEPATCLNSAYKVMKCDNCTETYNEYVPSETAVPHNYVWSFSHGLATGTCSVCGNVVTVEIPEDGAHVYDTVTVDTPPTCMTSGQVTIKCSADGTSITKEIPAIPGHHPTNKITTVYTEPTCLGAGSIVTTCTECNTQLYSQTISAVGHQYDVANSVVEPQPTCIAEGVRTFTCPNCDAETAGHTITEAVAKVQHVFAKTSTESATCLTPAYDVYTCTQNGCTEFYKVATAPANGHVFEIDRIENGTLYLACANCDATAEYAIGDTSGYTFDRFTVTTKPTCIANGAGKLTVSSLGDASPVITVVIPMNNSYHSNVATVNTPATCQSAGSVISTCQDCGTPLSTEVIPQLHHAWVENTDAREFTAATCTADGSIVYHYICENTGCETQTKTETTILPANGHKWFFVAPTCTADGYIKCAVCTAEMAKADILADTALAARFAPNGTELDAIGHSYGAWYRISDTKHERMCIHGCGVTEQADHTYDDGVVATPATCTGSGVKTYTCTACGRSYSEPIQALGHDFTAKTDNSNVQVIEKTCDTPEYTIITCTREGCGAQQWTQTGSATGHNYGAWTKVADNVYQRKCANNDEHIEALTFNGGHLIGVPGSTYFTATMTADDGYVFTSENTVMLGGIPQSAVNYNYDLSEDRKTVTIAFTDSVTTTGNIDIIARTEPITYTYTLLNPLGDSITESYSIETPIQLPVLEKRGYTFGNWKVTAVEEDGNWTVSDNIITAIPAGKYGNVTLTAQWTVNQYTVSYRGDDKTSGVPDAFTKTFGESVTLSSAIPSKPCYTFTGWMVFGTEDIYQPGDTFGSEATPDYADEYTIIYLDAQWTTVDYTATFVLNGSPDTISDITYTVESNNIPLPVPNRNGYTFDGWKVTTGAGCWTNGTEHVESIPQGSYGNVTFTAQWTANEYTYSFDLNGGSGDVTGGTYTPDSEPIALPTADQVTRTGYTLAGWCVSEAGSTPSSWTVSSSAVANQISTGSYGNVTFKAIWVNGEFTATYEGSHYSATNSDVEGNTVFTTTVTAEDGFHLPDSITVKVNGVTLEADAYTYNFTELKQTAVITIPASLVLGNIEITLDAVAHDFTASYEHIADTDTHKAFCECGQYQIENCIGGTATCTAKPVCELCGEEYSSKLPHTLKVVEARGATCTTNGNYTYYVCRTCGKLFKDEAGTTETTLEAETLPAFGHDFTGAVRDNGDGTHSFKCSRCGTYGAVIDGVQKPLAAGGKVAHTFDQEKQSREYVHNYANCYEPLTYYKSCVCGAKGTDTFTPEGATALGHAWLEFPEQKATCTQAGHSMYWECQRCHEQGGPENDYHPYVLYPATGHGAYYYDADKSGASADGSIKWEAYSCENKCGDYYLKKVTITSLDANGARVPNVNVRIVDSAGKTVVNDKTNGNGELVIEGSSYSNSLHPGRYDIYLEYVRDGSNYNTHGTVNFADGKVTGSFGKLTPYGGNASGSIGGKPTGEFRCSMCDLNDSMKNKPVIGWFISIIHAFVHAISRISR